MKNEIAELVAGTRASLRAKTVIQNMRKKKKKNKKKEKEVVKGYDGCSCVADRSCTPFHASIPVNFEQSNKRLDV